MYLLYNSVREDFSAFFSLVFPENTLIPSFLTFLLLWENAWQKQLMEKGIHPGSCAKRDSVS